MNDCDGYLTREKYPIDVQRNEQNLMKTPLELSKKNAIFIECIRYDSTCTVCGLSDNWKTYIVKIHEYYVSI